MPAGHLTCLRSIKCTPSSACTPNGRQPPPRFLMPAQRCWRRTTPGSNHAAVEDETKVRAAGPAESSRAAEPEPTRQVVGTDGSTCHPWPMALAQQAARGARARHRQRAPTDADTPGAEAARKPSTSSSFLVEIPASTPSLAARGRLSALEKDLYRFFWANCPRFPYTYSGHL